VPVFLFKKSEVWTFSVTVNVAQCSGQDLRTTAYHVGSGPTSFFVCNNYLRLMGLWRITCYSDRQHIAIVGPVLWRCMHFFHVWSTTFYQWRSQDLDVEGTWEMAVERGSSLHQGKNLEMELCRIPLPPQKKIRFFVLKCIGAFWCYF